MMPQKVMVALPDGPERTTALQQLLVAGCDIFMAGDLFGSPDAAVLKDMLKGNGNGNGRLIAAAIEQVWDPAVQWVFENVDFSHITSIACVGTATEGSWSRTAIQMLSVIAHWSRGTFELSRVIMPNAGNHVAFGEIHLVDRVLPVTLAVMESADSVPSSTVSLADDAGNVRNCTYDLGSNIAQVVHESEIHDTRTVPIFSIYVSDLLQTWLTAERDSLSRWRVEPSE